MGLVQTVRKIFQKPKTTVTIDNRPAQQLEMRRVEYHDTTTSGGTTIISGTQKVATIVGGGGSGVKDMSAKQVITAVESGSGSTTISQPQVTTISLSAEAQKKLQQEQQLKQMQSQTGLKQTMSLQPTYNINQPVYTSLTYFERNKGFNRSKLTGQKNPIIEYVAFDPKLESVGDVDIGGERQMTRAEIEKYFPLTADKGTRPTTYGKVKTSITKEVYGGGGILDYGKGINEFGFRGKDYRVFGTKEQGGVIALGKEKYIDLVLTPPKTDKQYFGKGVVEKGFGISAGIVRGIVPETVGQVGITTATLGAGAIIGVGTSTIMNVVSAYSPKAVPYVAGGIKTIGYGSMALWGGSETMKFFEAPTYEQKGQILGSSTRELFAFHSGLKTGSAFAQKSSLLKYDVEVKVGKSTKQIQEKPPQLIKQDVRGRAGDVILSTTAGKPLKGTGEAATYIKKTPLTYTINKPFSSKITKTIEIPTKTTVSTEFGKNIIGTKQVSEGVFKFKGTGTRTDIISTKFLDVYGKNVALRNIAIKEVKVFDMKGTVVKTGTKTYFGQLSEPMRLKTVERVTIREPTFADKRLDIFLQGKAFGKGIRGRPSLVRGDTFEFTPTAKIETPDYSYTYGKSLSQFISGGRKTNVYFTSITRTPSEMPLDISFTKTGGGRIISGGSSSSSSFSSSKSNLVQTSKADTIAISDTAKGFSLGGVKSPTIIKTGIITQTGLSTKTSMFPSVSATSITDTKTTQTQIYSTSQFATTLTSSTNMLANIQTSFGGTKVGSGLIQAPSQSLTQITIPIQQPTNIPKSSYGFTPSSTRTRFEFPPQDIQPVLPSPFKFGFGGGMPFRRIKGRKPRRKYTPDFPSLVLQRRGKAPKVKTGLEMRPIPKGFRWDFSKMQ